MWSFSLHQSLLQCMFTHFLQYFPPFNWAFFFIRNYSVVSEMWQTIFTRSAHSSSYDFSPAGEIWWPSSCTVCHENNWALHKFSAKKKLFCLLFLQQVPLQVCCITNFDTHLRWYSFTFKMTGTKYKWYCWKDTWPRYWQSCFWLTNLTVTYLILTRDKKE